MQPVQTGTSTPHVSYGTAAPGNLEKLMKLALQAQEAIGHGRIPEAAQACKELFVEGRHHVARVVLEDRHANPLPVALTLVEILAHPGIQFEDELKGEIARAARLFVELTAFKCFQEKRKPYAETVQSIREQLMRIHTDLAQDKSPQRVNDQVQLYFNVTCCLEALKSMESTDYSDFITGMITILTKQNILTAFNLIKSLRDQLGKSWFADLLFISWMGSLCAEDEGTFNTLAADISRLSQEEPKIALGSVEFYADMILRGFPTIQSKALDGLIELANLRGGRFARHSYWKVRYRVVQHLHTQCLHPNPAIKDKAIAALLLINAREGNKNIRGLFEQIEQNPQLVEQWKRQFTQENASLWEEKAREEQELNEKTRALEARERKLAQQAGQHSTALARQRQQVTFERQSLEQEKAEFEAKASLWEKKAREEQRLNEKTRTLEASEQEKAEFEAKASLWEEKDREEQKLNEKARALEDRERKLAQQADQHSTDLARQRQQVTRERKSLEQEKAEFEAKARNLEHLKGLLSKQVNNLLDEVFATAHSSQASATEISKEFLCPITGQPMIDPVSTPAGDSYERFAIITHIREKGTDPLTKQNLTLEDLHPNKALRNMIEEFYRNQRPQSDLNENIPSPQHPSGLMEPPQVPPLPLWDALSPQGRALLQKLSQLNIDVSFTSKWESVQEDVNVLINRSQEGDAEAQHLLGICFHRGLGVVRDVKQAAKNYAKAAEQGHTQAQFNLGVCYYFGEGVAKNAATSVEWFSKAAERGHANAQNNLGCCYTDGEGVLQDDKIAAKWYSRAAEQGQAEAQFELGKCYEDGKGVAKNDKIATKWYSRAAEQGDAQAQFNLSVCYYFGEGVAKNEAIAAKWCSKSAEQGDANAQYNLGYCYENGKGVAKDDKTAAQWYSKAAEQEDARAQYNLGKCYENGKGVAKNDKTAFEWCSKSAEQGDARAQCNLGVHYNIGKGVAKNDKTAAQWYLKAAEQGHAQAQFNLSYCYEEGLGVTKNEVIAAKWCSKAAEQGHARAQCQLGVFYEKGRGVPKNEAIAEKWYSKAEEQGIIPTLSLLPSPSPSTSPLPSLSPSPLSSPSPSPPPFWFLE